MVPWFLSVSHESKGQNTHQTQMSIWGIWPKNIKKQLRLLQAFWKPTGFFTPTFRLTQDLHEALSLHETWNRWSTQKELDSFCVNPMFSSLGVKKGYWPTARRFLLFSCETHKGTEWIAQESNLHMGLLVFQQHMQHAANVENENMCCIFLKLQRPLKHT